MRPEEFWARMLAARFSEALEFYQPNQALLMNYTQLPEAACGPMLKFFGTICSQEDMEHMRSAATWDAKAPSRKFRNHADQDRNPVSATAQALVDRLVMPLYERLEATRTGESKPPV
jgi:hypothetical protein